MSEAKEQPIRDPHNVPVDFINQVVGSGHMNGVANLTLAVAQFTPQSETSLAPAGVAVDLVIASRLRMDLVCAQQMHAVLGRLIEQMSEQTRPQEAIN